MTLVGKNKGVCDFCQEYFDEGLTDLGVAHGYRRRACATCLEKLEGALKGGSDVKS